MINRREFIKRAGSLAVVAAGAGSLPFISACGGSLGDPSPTDKLPFLSTESLEDIRAKIAHNGYTFTVDHNYEYDTHSQPKTTSPMPNPFTVPAPADMILHPNTDELLKPTGPLPALWDWRNHNGHAYIGPTRDQGETNICWCFSAIAAAECAYNVAHGLYDNNRVELSELYLIFTVGAYKPYRDHYTGTAFIAANDMNFYTFYALTKAGAPEGACGLEGSCRLNSFGFDPFYYLRPPTPELIEASKKFERFQLKRWARVFPTNYADTTEQIKVAIMKYGAVAASIDHPAAFNAYKSGVYEDTVTMQPDADPYYYAQTEHAVALVGWDDNPPEGGGGCWILRNTYTNEPPWGEDGYIRIRYFSAKVNTQVAFIDGGPTAGPYSISGRCTLGTGAAAGVTLSLTGVDTWVAMATGEGNYGLTGLADGKYRVTPSKSSYAFSPPYRDVTIAGASAPNCDFEVIAH